MKNKEMVSRLENGIVIAYGYTFFTGKSRKFDADLENVISIMEKGVDNLTTSDRMKLLTIYQAAYHTSGKIEDIMSFDSSATNCEFCKAMRKKAEKNPAHICNFCYDFSAEKFKTNSLNRHSLNLLIMWVLLPDRPIFGGSCRVPHWSRSGCARKRPREPSLMEWRLPEAVNHMRAEAPQKMPWKMTWSPLES